MRKSIYLTLGLCVCCIAINAQTINSSNMPLEGDSVIIALSDQPVDPGTDGSGQTWDMTWLTESEEQYFNFVDPASTPWGDLFPGASLCGVSWDDYYSFYNISGSALEAVGYAGLISGTDTFTSVFTDVESFIPLPFSFGDTNMDDFSGTNNVLGFSVPFTGDVDFEVDGTGTLILPTGTYDNVVRYHLMRTQETTVMGSTTTVTKEQWGWVSADHRFWLLIMEENFDGFLITPLIWYNKDPQPAVVTSLEANSETDFSVFPNPIASQSPVIINWSENGSAMVSLTSISGQTVWEQRVELVNGNNVLSSLTEGLQAGAYYLTIRKGGIVSGKSIMVVD